MLRFDFYESGKGETIIITFPDGGIGIVDAHPSAGGGRPGISELIRGKDIHFVCLSHPHYDHGADLVPVLQSTARIASFWHTVPEVKSFFLGLGRITNYSGPTQQFVQAFRANDRQFLIKLFAAVADR